MSQSYSITTIDDKDIWESTVSSFSEANFLQSWNWGLFHQRLGKKVLRLHLRCGATVVGLVQAVVEPARRGKYLAVAGGPVLDWQDRRAVQVVFDELTFLAKQSHCSFIRFRPQATVGSITTEVLSQLKAHKAPMHLTADVTLQLDITQDESVLLQQMRKNTRASIRKAERMGITTTISTESSEVRAFYQEQKKLAQKQQFVPFSYQFLLEQFKAFMHDDQVCLVHAFSAEGEKLASAFVIIYNNEAVYHYGVSTDLNKKLPGSYACQWKAIQTAKKRHCTRYNFWGVVPDGVNNHRFSGVSLFKKGFGGESVAYLPAHDIPLSWWYWGVYLLETVRRKARRL